MPLSRMMGSSRRGRVSTRPPRRFAPARTPSRRISESEAKTETHFHPHGGSREHYSASQTIMNSNRYLPVTIASKLSPHRQGFFVTSNVAQSITSERNPY